MWFWGMQRMMPKNDGWLLVWWLFGRIFHFAPPIKVRFHHSVIWGDPLTSVFGYLKYLKLRYTVTISWVVVSNIFYFQPYLGKISNLTSIFFRWVGSTTNQFFYLVIQSASSILNNIILYNTLYRGGLVSGATLVSGRVSEFVFWSRCIPHRCRPFLWMNSRFFQGWKSMETIDRFRVPRWFLFIPFVTWRIIPVSMSLATMVSKSLK